ncbi:MAG: acetoin utilization protein AcuC [Actinomycetales bacterium]
MSERVAVVWDDRLGAYDFGPGHPLAPIRVQLAMRLAIDLGLLEQPNALAVGDLEPATLADLQRVHDPEYVAAVQRASADPDFTDVARGLGTSDDPVFAGMHEAAARVAGATLTAARAVQTGRAEHAVNLAGGLHHAMPQAASGFCIYNDIGVAIAWLLDQGVERVAYVDVDVHHGDGVQAMFWDDPRVLTMSIHESPRTLFPGTGSPTEIGGPRAQGTAVNLALPAGTGDQGWLRAFHAVVPQILEAFAPQILVTQHGVDTHADDPLAHLNLSIDGQRMSYQALHRWAHRFAQGRWVAVGGGGYSWVNVVPRAWSHLIAEALAAPIDPHSELPKSYLDFVLARLGEQSPRTMTDGRTPWPKPFDDDYAIDDPVDAAILETRRAVFEFWGLEPESDRWNW